MSWSPLEVAVVLCTTMALAEALLSSRDLVAWLSSLKRPRLYAPLWVWMLVALLTYLLQGVIAFRLVAHAHEGYGMIALLALFGVMAANVAYNVVLDRTRNPAWAYRGLLWFLPLLIALQVLLFWSDTLSAWLNLAYVAWVLAYDLPIMRAVSALNSSDLKSPHSGEPSHKARRR